MSRSIWKGPFLDYHIYKTLRKVQPQGKQVKRRFKKITLWSRRSVIRPEMIGTRVHIHNGKKYIPLFISEEMIGHKFGEFAYTRLRAKHKVKTK